MKRTTKIKTRGLIYFSIFTLVVLGAASNIQNKNISTLKDYKKAVEVTYKAESPLGDLGGSVLPASCESGAWNSNGNYHIDGTTSDPGCALPVAADGVCGPADGVETVNQPATDLCRTGTASSINGNGPWNWKCLGVSGGKDVSCQSPKQNAKNDPPETPVLSGDMWAIKGQSTSNQIVSTDPERDEIFYELDWDCSGSVDGTTSSYSSGVSAPIGHTYNTIGTYKVCGRAVQSNDTTKRSGIGEYTIRVTEGVCTSAANACGVTSGTIVGGVCTIPGLPNGYGNTCAGPANSCGMTNVGTIGCDGSCSERSAPNNNLCPRDPIPVVPIVPGQPLSIINFSASPRLVASGKNAKLYWEVQGNIASCRITYTTLTNSNPVNVTNSLIDNKGQRETDPIREKRFYRLTCGAQEREAIVSIFSLTEI